MQFIQARNYTKTDGRAIDLIVLHTMESAERPDSAEAVATWFAGPDAPQASAHYCVDNNSVVRCVRDKDVAWAAPGANSDGLQIEHAGRAAQDSAAWADPYSSAMLRRSAALVGGLCTKYEIPATYLDVPDLLANRRGITTHNNVSRAFRRSDHTDPGKNWPFERYIRLVRGYVRPITDPVKPIKPPPETLTIGDNGWLVKRAQQMLVRVLPRRIQPATDGVFGPKTEAAVKEFQRRSGLVADGIVGPMTWKALRTAQAA